MYKKITRNPRFKFSKKPNKPKPLDYVECITADKHQRVEQVAHDLGQGPC